MTFKKSLRLGLGFGLAGVFLWLVLRQISLNELIEAFSETNISYILAAIVIFFIGYACRIERWRLMLSQDNPNLQWRNCAGPLMASVAANNILPFRGGDLLRAFGFNRRLEISAATSLTTLVVERLFDLLMVFAILGLVLTYFGMESSRFIGIGGSLLSTFSLVILFVLLFPKFFKPLVFLLPKLFLKISSKLGEKALQELEKVFSALEHIAQKHIMLQLVGWSAAAWVLEGLVFWITALSLPSIVNHFAAWFAMPVGTLSTVIPSSPGYVGTFDYFTVQAMASLNNPLAISTAYALLVHVILWLPATLVGGIYFLLNPVSYKSINKEAL